MSKGLSTLSAYQEGGPVLDKLKQLWGNIRSRADDPSWGYVGASMLPGVGEATDLIEIGAGLQDRDLGRMGLGLGALALPFVGASTLKKIGTTAKKKALTESEKKQLKKQTGDFISWVMEEGKLPEKASTEMPYATLPDVMRKNIEQAYQRPPGRFARLSVKQADELDDLPMDPESLARRSKEQGYTELFHGTPEEENLLLGGLTKERYASGRYRPFYQVDNPRAAKTYEGRHLLGQPKFGGVLKTYSRAPSQLVFDAGGSSWTSLPLKSIREAIDPDRLDDFERYLRETRSWQLGGAGKQINPFSKVSTDDLAQILGNMNMSGFDAHNLIDLGDDALIGGVADLPSMVRATLAPGLVRLEGARFDPKHLGTPELFYGIGALGLSNALREDRRGG